MYVRVSVMEWHDLSLYSGYRVVLLIRRHMRQFIQLES